MESSKEKKQKLHHVADDLRNIVEHLRVQKRLSLRGLALRAGISSGRISEILNGKRPLTKYYLDKIIGALWVYKPEQERLRKLLLQTIVQAGTRTVKVKSDLGTFTTALEKGGQRALKKLVHRFEHDLALLLLRHELCEDIEVIVEIKSTGKSQG